MNVPASFSAEPATVHVVADLIERFPKAKVRDAVESRIQPEARCGNTVQDALFLHPGAAASPAWIEYELELPKAIRGELLLLLFDVGIAEGARFDQGEDGVKFLVELDGRRHFERQWRQCAWSEQALNLTAFEGRRVRLSLGVDANQDTRHDWALWGRPRIVWFRGAAWPDSGATLGAYGILALRLKGTNAVRVRLQPGESTMEQEWQVPAAAEGEQEAWRAHEIIMPGAHEIRIDCDPPDAVAELWRGDYEGRLLLAQVAPGQAMSGTNQPVQLQATVRNEGLGVVPAGSALVQIEAKGQLLPVQPVPELSPGDQAQLEWTWTTPSRGGTCTIQAKLIENRTGNIQEMSCPLDVFFRPAAGYTWAISNRLMKIEFIRSESGYAYARIYARRDEQWVQAGLWRPLMRVIYEGTQGLRDWEIRPRQFNRGRTPDNSRPGNLCAFEDVLADPDGISWGVALRVTLDADQPIAHLHYEWQASAQRRIRALWGPNLYAGEETTGNAKTWGLFPGLEYLYADEPSSNRRDFAAPWHDRRTPHPHKITLPLMAVSTGPDSPVPRARTSRFYCPDSHKDMAGGRPMALAEPVTLGLFWNPLQRWDGIHDLPSARFSSPNADQGMRNHRLGLFLPSVPEWVSENADQAQTPYVLAPAQILTLEATLVASPGHVTAALREYYRAQKGMPGANPWPRSFEDELEICRRGFLETVWDASQQRWRHCVDWQSNHAPGFATLLWVAAQVAGDAAGRRESIDRVELVSSNMLAEGGAGLFISTANCHIMRWEFPFHYGHLPDAMVALEKTMRDLMETQTPDGGWVFRSTSPKQNDLGHEGDSVLGLCATPASQVMRYARITGDSTATRAGLKALEFMERFRLPRGSQTWECPMYEPDLLAAAHAMAANVEGFRAKGDPRWLQNALYWAETGLPFIYQWSLTNKPMMLGASIPVFGSTFYTHSWLGMPVQWCGLVYAYHLQHLIEALEQQARNSSKPQPEYRVGLTIPDWKRLAESILVSAMHQQFDRGNRLGTYPDSISGFEQPNPAFLNPEDIMANVLAIKGFDPDIRTAWLDSSSGPVTISTAAKIEQAAIEGNELVLRLSYFSSLPCFVLITRVVPIQVHQGDVMLVRSEQPLQRAPGWYRDANRGWTFINTMPNSAECVIRIKCGE